MTPCLIQLTNPNGTNQYGCCTTFSGLAGIKHAIKIRRSILDGTPLGLKWGNRDEAGCRLFLEDVLLHEALHQYAYEVSGETDESYRGHGPGFSRQANRISAILGLPQVGKTSKKRDHEDKGLPAPQYWPHNVRPDEYYRGAYVASREDEDEPVKVPTPTPEPEADPVGDFSPEETLAAAFADHAAEVYLADARALADLLRDGTDDAQLTAGLLADFYHRVASYL
jgi:hypothetical protein